MEHTIDSNGDGIITYNKRQSKFYQIYFDVKIFKVKRKTVSLYVL